MQQYLALSFLGIHCWQFSDKGSTQNVSVEHEDSLGFVVHVTW